LPIPLLTGLDFHGEQTVDWLDKLSIAAMAGIAVITIGMLANQQLTKKGHDNRGVEASEEKSAHASEMEMDKELYQEVRSYEEQGLYEEAIQKLEDIMKSHPEKPLSYVYLARLDFKQGKLGDSIHNYRRAVVMEPDYVDKRTSLFIGDKIKQVVVEGREKFGREKELKPQDQEVRETLKDIYYLQSRLAGGCE
jgi:tetratricopeptide (TPR) repeat protein